MAGLALSGGTLLSVLHGKRVYQPIWQILAVQSSSGSSSNQLLVSDGKNIIFLCLVYAYEQFIKFEILNPDSDHTDCLLID